MDDRKFAYHDTHAGFPVVSMVCLCKSQARANDSVGGLACLHPNPIASGLENPAPTSRVGLFFNFPAECAFLAGGREIFSTTLHPFAPVQAVCRLIPNHRLHLKENGRLQVDDSIGQTHPAGMTAAVIVAMG